MTVKQEIIKFKKYMHILVTLDLLTYKEFDAVVKRFEHDLLLERE